MNYIFNPLEQFKIQEIFSLSTIFGSFSLTNSSLYLALTTFVVFYLYNLSINKQSVKLMTSNSSSMVVTESLYKSIFIMVKEQIGEKYTIYMPFIFTLFNLILVSNFLGLIPYGFSPTAQFAFPLALSITIILGVTIIGFQKHGLVFFSVLLPSGTPLGLVPLLLLIELLSYFSRALSLGIRLAANITSGHILLNIFSGFILKASGLVILFTIIPFTLFILLMGLELMVTILQAYVWSILTCMYIKDSLILH